MSKVRLSHSQRELYALCPRKYYYKYVRKMRPKEKGSALFFGTAFDDATGELFEGKTLDEAKGVFTNEWMRHEDNADVKFSKSDYTDKILLPVDINSLETAALNLGKSKPMQEYEAHRNVKTLIKDLIKIRDNFYVRDLNDREKKFVHYANMLCMHRKGHLMLDSFHREIFPHVTKVHGTQVPISIKDDTGNEVIGYIDLLCEMAGYELPNGRVLKEGEVIVGDIKSAGPFSWKKHDKLDNAPQLDTYLISSIVQDKAMELTGKPTNLISYMVTSKTIVNNSESYCDTCGIVKTTRHKTCSSVASGSRCNGTWKTETNFYVDSKIVIGERDLSEAEMMFHDFNDTLTGIQNKVFPRNRNSCDAFNSVCDYADICGKCFKDPEKAIENWIEKKGEKRG